ncbi:MAG: hypothetical protein PVF68_05880 [Acidobacteriota bacterium]|jgi:hypothetical protein
MRRTILTILTIPFVITLAGASASHQEPGSVSAEATAGPYSVTLKVLPAESFGGSSAEMMWDGGAQAVKKNGSEQPNHHLVAFVKRDGKPVTDANVGIRYRRLESKGSSWSELPVARMHVTDKGAETTHYGNNVDLAAGRYAVRIDVNGDSTTLNVSVAS